MQMRKIIAAVAALTGFMFMAVAAPAQTGPQAWNVSLSFATQNAEDPLPVVIGVEAGTEGITELKPPPLPGLKDVGDARYAVVSSWVEDAAGSNRVVTRKLGRGASVKSAYSWPITVMAEESGAPVFVTPKLDGLPQGMSVYLVDTAAGARVLLKNNQTEQVYQSDGGARELVAVASAAGSFVAADRNGKVYGYMETSANKAAAGAQIYVDGSANPAASIAEDGSFSLNLAPGSHNLVIDSRSALKSTVSITVAGDAPTGAEPPELRVGDINNDGVIDIADFAYMKKSFGKSVEEAGDSAPDLNGDGVIDIADYANIKKHYGADDGSE